MSASQDITAVLVSFNSAGVLPQALAALKRAGVHHFVVVDNASRDESVAIAQAEGAQIVQNTENLGFGVASNLGFAQVKTPLAFLVNPDCVVDAHCVAALHQASIELPNTVIFSPLLKLPNGHTFVRGVSILCPYLAGGQRRKVLPNGAASYPIVSGAAMLIRMSVFENGQVFDPNIFLYHEDDDLCRRVWAMGSSCVIVPEAVAVHDGNTSSPLTTHLQYWKGWHMAWSELYVRRKYGLGSMRILKILRILARLCTSAILFKHYDFAYCRGFFSGLIAFYSGKLASEIKIPPRDANKP